MFAQRLGMYMYSDLLLFASRLGLSMAYGPETP